MPFSLHMFCFKKRIVSNVNVICPQSTAPCKFECVSSCAERNPKFSSGTSAIRYSIVVYGESESFAKTTFVNDLFVARYLPFRSVPLLSTITALVAAADLCFGARRL